MHTISRSRLFFREYCNFGRRRDRYSDGLGGIANDGMAHRARELYSTEPPEVVRLLREAAARAGVLDQVHMVRHGQDLDGPHLIPLGATNHQIIEIIEATARIESTMPGWR